MSHLNTFQKPRKKMNYRHIFHAGNFADVLKHSIFTLLLEKFLEKDKPFCVLDSHAGLGQYPLNSQPALKTGEAKSGIMNFMTQANLSPHFNPYLDCIRSFNTHSQDGLPVIHYPGSPMIAQHFLRPTDRLLACELQPDDYILLDKACRPYKNIKTFKNDAFKWLNGELPPLEKRALILIDPPYEDAMELKKIVKQMRLLVPKFSHGVYAIWYPIKTYYNIEHFHRALVQASGQPVLFAELCLHPCTDPNRLNGCGMAIINPPWQLEDKLKKMLPQLLDCFSRKGYGRWRLFQQK